MQENEEVITDLTTAVFASTAPRYTDFFHESKIDLDEAKNGQKIAKIIEK